MKGYIEKNKPQNFYYIEGIDREQELRDLLDNKSEVHGKYINTNITFTHIIKRRIVLRQYNLRTKAFVLEELKINPEEAKKYVPQYEISGDIEYRLGYYIISPKKGKWLWAQFCPFIFPEDFKNLIEKAKEHNFIYKGN